MNPKEQAEAEKYGSIGETYPPKKEKYNPVIDGKSCKCKTCHTGIGAKTNPRSCPYCLKRRKKITKI